MWIWFGETERTLSFTGSECSRMACALASCGNKKNRREAKQKAISTSRWRSAFQDICLLLFIIVCPIFSLGAYPIYPERHLQLVICSLHNSRERLGWST